MTINTRVKVESSDVEVMYIPQVQRSFLGLKHWSDVDRMTACSISTWAIINAMEYGFKPLSKDYAEAVCRYIHNKSKEVMTEKEKERRHSKTKTVDFYKFP